MFLIIKLLKYVLKKKKKNHLAHFNHALSSFGLQINQFAGTRHLLINQIKLEKEFKFDNSTNKKKTFIILLILFLYKYYKYYFILYFIENSYKIRVILH